MPPTKSIAIITATLGLGLSVVALTMGSSEKATQQPKLASRTSERMSTLARRESTPSYGYASVVAAPDDAAREACLGT